MDSDQYPELADPAFVEEVWERLAKHDPAMKESLPVRGYSGGYDLTRECDPIISAHSVI